MTNRKIKKLLKTYTTIGRSLCASAGGILGFILGGPVGAIPGVFVGIFSSFLFEKALLGPAR